MSADNIDLVRENPKTPLKTKLLKRIILRAIRKTIRFSNEEYYKIDLQLKKANINFASFCRKSLLKTKITLPIEKDMLFEINKIGNNLNQIARAVNKKEKTQVLIKLIEIEKQLKEILK